ncbi:MAG: ABC transporter permease [bacterium]|nr:ABC transporter permease [bacterium]
MDTMNKPPKIAEWLLKRLTYYNYKFLCSGDLSEDYILMLKKNGTVNAYFWYWSQVMKSIIPYLYYSITKGIIMLKNYIKTTFRNIRRHKSFSFFNILGLSIGMTSCILILLYVRFEESYDSFHKDAERIYRVRMDSYRNNEKSFESAVTYPAVGPALKNDFPEVEEFTRLYPHVRGIVRYGDKIFREENMFYVDDSFFSIFSYELLKGDKNAALAEPNSVIISESIAGKYFGDADPIGEIIILNDNDLKVTSVFKDIPENSHLAFDFLISINTFEQDLEPGVLETSWGWYDFYTYIKLQPGTDPDVLQLKLPSFIENYNGEYLNAHNSELFFILQPLQDIHLNSNLSWEAEVNGNGKAVLFLTVVAYLVLIIALINFINLSTARSFERAREVGVRKVVGAFKSQLVNHFILEAIILCIISMLVCTVLVFTALPYLSILISKDLSVVLFSAPFFWVKIFLVFIVGMILTAFYPSIILSSFKPVSIIKGVNKTSKSGLFTRKGLLTVQFAISIFILSSTLIIFKQLNYMTNFDIGMDLDQTLVIVNPESTGNIDQQMNRVNTFKEKLETNPQISGFASSQGFPGRENYWISSFHSDNMSEEDRVNIYINSIDDNYIDLFNIELLAGRKFSEEIITDDSLAVIINERAVKLLQYNSPEESIGKYLYSGERKWSIVGVINDYYDLSLKKQVEPNIFFLDYSDPGYFELKINMSNNGEVIEYVRQEWDSCFEQLPFEYFFADEFYNRQYYNEKRFGKIFSIFSFLTLFVACLGILGLSTYLIGQRTKEIGIRKALGSSSSRIGLLLTSEFTGFIIAANIISYPVMYIVMSRWLQGFARHVDPDIGSYLLSVIAVLMISLLTISYKTVKASLVNPVDSLRYE